MGCNWFRAESAVEDTTVSQPINISDDEDDEEEDESESKKEKIVEKPASETIDSKKLFEMFLY